MGYEARIERRRVTVFFAGLLVVPPARFCRASACCFSPAASPAASESSP